MNTPRNPVRTYNIKAYRTISQGGPDCAAFGMQAISFAKLGREILSHHLASQGERCFVELRFRCNSCKASGPERYRKVLRAAFPDVVFEEFRRER